MKQVASFDGVLTSLVTPFTHNGVDFETLGALALLQKAGGAGGLVVGGLAGEGPTLTEAEFIQSVQAVVEAVSGDLPVMAATGTACTRTTVERSLAAKQAGVAAVLVVVPYYSRPSQEGLFRHYEAVACAAGLPVIVHNAPRNTGCDLALQTLDRIANLEGMEAVIDESESPSRIAMLAALCAGRIQVIAPSEEAPFAVHARPRACFSTVSNILPSESAVLWRRRMEGVPACGDGRLTRLARALAGASAPPALKYAMSCVLPGFGAGVRPPMVDVTPDRAAAIRTALDIVRAAA